MKRGVPAIIVLTLLLINSCGSIVFTSKIATPPPPWYYPNKVETVRYIYFPDYEIYYDFYKTNYLYCNDGEWFNASTLPKRFYGINLERSKKVRVTNYYGDDIKKYHCEIIIKKRNSNPRRYQ